MKICGKKAIMRSIKKKEVVFWNSFVDFRGVDPNSHDTKLNTPLIIAAKTGRAHNIRALMDCTITTENEEGENKIEKKVKINFKNKRTMTALHYAAKRGFIVSKSFFFITQHLIHEPAFL